ncbi:MAG: hypothetical protein SNJ74_12935, partial [Fimbriimonadaceae bacterium]
MLAERLFVLGSAIRLENANLALGVRPVTGRVRHLGLRSGPNLPRESVPPAVRGGWTDSSGDKLGFSPQSAGNGPPEPDPDA